MLEKESSNNTLNLSSNDESSFSNASGTNSPAPIFSTLKKEDQSKALYLASQLDVSRYENIVRFGEESQRSLKDFSHHMLVYVQRNDTSPIREILSSLASHLETINPDELIEKKGFFRNLLRPRKKSIQQIVSQYNRLSKQIDRLSIQLKRAQQGLLSDIEGFNELYDKNENYYHQISLYIAAGEMKKQDLIKEQMKLENNLTLSDDPMLNQKLKDLQDAIEWLYRRIYDLQISREVALQTATQIRMIQATNQMLVEKIQSSIMSTIPMWQSQISMLVQMNRRRRVNMTSRRIMDTSEDMIRKNAKMMEITERDHNQKAITHEDVDQFKQTQLQLIESIEETLRIQADRNEKQTQMENAIHQIDENK